MEPGGNPTDEAALRRLGGELARRRVELRMTQAELAREAGVSLRTLTRIESGESAQVTNLVRVLRALGLLPRLLEIVPPAATSPLALLRAQAKREKQQRRRVRHASKRGKVARRWTWGDDGATPAEDGT